MKSLRKKRRIQVIMISFGALAVCTALIGYAMRDGINYFRSPSQVVETPPSDSETFRIGGLVEAGSIRHSENGDILFRVSDGGAAVEVVFKGVLPDLFAEKQGMIGTGRLKEGIFMASEILAKHDETYMPREVIDALKEQGVYQGNSD